MPISIQKTLYNSKEVFSLNFSYSEITSRKNENIIWASKLGDKKHRDKEGVFFAEGIKLLEEAILSHLNIEKIFFTQKALSLYGDILEKSGSDEYILVTDDVFEKLTDEMAPQGIFTVIKKPKSHIFSEDSINEGGFIMLEDIQNPQNLGAIFRCAYSLGGKKIVLSGKCADVYGPKTLRSGMGSIFRSEFIICDDIHTFIEGQKSVGNKVYCTHLHSESLKLGSFSFKASDSIVIGNEGHGVSDKTVSICDGSVIIPMVEGAESLNAATASSIIIWEMNKAKLY